MNTHPGTPSHLPTNTHTYLDRKKRGGRRRGRERGRKRREGQEKSADKEASPGQRQGQLTYEHQPK
jgi:hypothetical protein